MATQGLKFHVYMQQVVAHVECLLCHSRTDLITGQLLEASLEVSKTKLSLGGSLLQKELKVIGFLLTDSWIKAV